MCVRLSDYLLSDCVGIPPPASNSDTIFSRVPQADPPCGSSGEVAFSGVTDQEALGSTVETSSSPVLTASGDAATTGLDQGKKKEGGEDDDFLGILKDRSYGAGMRTDADEQDDILDSIISQVRELLTQT